MAREKLKTVGRIKCEDCGHQRDVTLWYEKPCPKCGKTKARIVAEEKDIDYSKE